MSEPVPPAYHLRDLGPAAQAMSRAWEHLVLCMTGHDVSRESMLVMTGSAAGRLLKRVVNSQLLELDGPRPARPSRQVSPNG
jgi:hypothetical protein